MPFASPQSEPACLSWSDLLAQGWSEEAILGNYPGLSLEDIRACLNYASAALHDEKVYPLKA